MDRIRRWMRSKLHHPIRRQSSKNTLKSPKPRTSSPVPSSLLAVPPSSTAPAESSSPTSRNREQPSPLPVSTTSAPNLRSFPSRGMRHLRTFSQQRADPPSISGPFDTEHIVVDCPTFDLGVPPSSTPNLVRPGWVVCPRQSTAPDRPAPIGAVPTPVRRLKSSNAGPPEPRRGHARSSEVLSLPLNVAPSFEDTPGLDPLPPTAKEIGHNIIDDLQRSHDDQANDIDARTERLIPVLRSLIRPEQETSSLLSRSTSTEALPDVIQPSPHRTECKTCTVELQLDAIPLEPQTCRSDHAPLTCGLCWNQWIESQISLVAPDQMTCVQCNTKLEEQDVKELARPDTYERYLDAQLKALLSADDDFVWCLASNCESGQIHDGGDIFTCMSCGYQQCIECNTAWHAGQRCRDIQRQVLQGQGNPQDQQRQRKLREESSTMDLLEAESKICPGDGCNRRVQKISGCDHMTCTTCGHEFCWLCLASYDRIYEIGNTAHEEYCEHHSHNLDTLVLRRERLSGPRFPPLPMPTRRPLGNPRGAE